MRHPTRTGTPPPAARRAKWWTTGHDESWEEVRDSVVELWLQREDRGTVDLEIAVRGMAFGHAARSAYPRMGTWDTDFRAQLREDWEDTRRDELHSWDRVSTAAKHGWECAGRANRRPAS